MQTMQRTRQEICLTKWTPCNSSLSHTHLNYLKLCQSRGYLVISPVTGLREEDQWGGGGGGVT